MIDSSVRRSSRPSTLRAFVACARSVNQRPASVAVFGSPIVRLWFAHCPFEVRFQCIYSQCTACSPRINCDLIKFFGIFETFGNGLALNEPDLRHSTDTYCIYNNNNENSIYFQKTDIQRNYKLYKIRFRTQHAQQHTNPLYT